MAPVFRKRVGAVPVSSPQTRRAYIKCGAHMIECAFGHKYLTSDAYLSSLLNNNPTMVRIWLLYFPISQIEEILRPHGYYVTVVCPQGVVECCGSEMFVEPFEDSAKEKVLGRAAITAAISTSNGDPVHIESKWAEAFKDELPKVAPPAPVVALDVAPVVTQNSAPAAARKDEFPVPPHGVRSPTSPMVSAPAIRPRTGSSASWPPAERLPGFEEKRTLALPKTPPPSLAGEMGSGKSPRPLRSAISWSAFPPKASPAFPQNATPRVFKTVPALPPTTKSVDAGGDAGPPLAVVSPIQAEPTALPAVENTAGGSRLRRTKSSTKSAAALLRTARAQAPDPLPSNLLHDWWPGKNISSPAAVTTVF